MLGRGKVTKLNSDELGEKGQQAFVRDRHAASQVRRGAPEPRYTLSVGARRHSAQELGAA